MQELLRKTLTWMIGLAAMCLVLVMMPGAAKAAAAETASNFSELQAAINNVDGGGTITITQNIELTGTLSFVLNNRHITITSSPEQQYTLKRANNFNTGPILYFPENNGDGRLTLTNIIIDGNGEVTGSDQNDEWGSIFYIYGGHTITLGEGSVLRNNNILNSINPSVAFCKDSTFVVAGGTITNNATPGSGIIRLTNDSPTSRGARFEMSSGLITNNTSARGAIDSNARNGVEITGGEISNNVGGAISHSNSSTLIIGPDATVKTSFSGKIVGNDTLGASGLAATVSLKRYATGAVLQTVTAGADGAYTFSDVPVASGEDSAYVIEASMENYLTKTSNRFSLYYVYSNYTDMTLEKTITNSQASLTANGVSLISGGSVVNGGSVSGGSGTAVFSTATNTLTLTNYTGGAIVSDRMVVNLVLEGTNVIDLSGSSGTSCITMTTSGNLNISGSGSLKAVSQNVAAFKTNNNGVDIQGGTLEIIANNANNAIDAGTGGAASITINGNAVTFSASASTNASGGGLGAIRAYSLNVTGSPALIMEGDSAASTTVSQLTFASNVTKKHVYVGPEKLPSNMNLTVNGTPMISAGQISNTSVSGSIGTAAFDTATNTLTLTNYSGGPIIAQNFDLTVVLVNTNTVSATAANDAIGVTLGSLTINGAGSLTASATDQYRNALSASGANGNITLSGGTITLSAGNNAHSVLASQGITISGDAVTLTATGGPDGALCVGTTVTVNGGTIKEGNDAAGATTVTSVTMTGSGSKYSKPYVYIGPAAPKYTVTVNGGTSDKATAAEDETVTITADTAPNGKEFDKWTTEDGVSFANENSASTTFTMPAKAVAITATYKDLPPSAYAINVQNDGHGTASADASSATAGTEITLTATANSGYQFKEWQVISGGVTVSDNKFTMPANIVTVKAVFELIPAATADLPLPRLIILILR